MSYCQHCPGDFSNLMYTFGGSYDGSGTKTNIANWINNPELEANYNSVRYSTNPRREAFTMFSHVKSTDDSKCCLAVPETDRDPAAGWHYFPCNSNKYQVKVSFPTCGPEVTLEWDCRKNRHDRVTFHGIEWPDRRTAFYSKRLDTDHLKPDGSKWGRCKYTMRELKCNIAYTVNIKKNRWDKQKPFVSTVQNPYWSLD